MEFSQKLKNYANLIASYGINVQQGQQVRIAVDACNRDFALELVRAIYQLGASLVTVDLIDRRFDRERILHNSLEQLAYVPRHVKIKYEDLVDESGATASIRGEEDPDIMFDLPEEKLSKMESSLHNALEYFYDQGISKSRVQWTVAAAATPNWAKRIFPELNPTDAQMALWEQILKICRCDREDYLEEWQRHNQKLKHRCQQLNDLGIKELHFGGKNCDLRVGLHSRARFLGGTGVTPSGVKYQPNLPTEECFTTPDLRMTEGVVSSTRPVLISGKLVSGLEMHFKDGKLVDFSAKEGAKTFEQMINSDEGARYVGEIALVGIDSPIYQSGLVFESILYDENAACHLALGRAYKFCIENGEQLTAAEMQEIGVNHSVIHKDIMISSESVSVTATSSNGTQIPLIINGKWQQNFA